MNPTAELLLKTAERLYALEGVDRVSTRNIAREAGQKNHSALQYHFGGRDQLIDAILSYRMTPLNTRRQEMLREYQAKDQPSTVRDLVELFLRPFAEELLKPPADSYYVSLIAQSCSRHQWDRVYSQGKASSSALEVLAELLVELLSPIPVDVIYDRIVYMAMQMVQVISEWDHQRRQGIIILDQATLEKRISGLLDYIEGGLRAAVS